jgi:hypothetical protein
MKSLTLASIAAVIIAAFYFWPETPSQNEIQAVNSPTDTVDAQQELPISTIPPVQQATTESGRAILKEPVTLSGLDPLIQDQVQQLSSRDNTQAQHVEIMPGVFLTDVSTIHQSVTVAQINADGSVQLTEH